jgi:hypothetical protein
MKRLLKALTRCLVILSAVASTELARAQSDDLHSAAGRSRPYVCSNRTIRGSYGFTVEGTILSLPGANLPPGTTLPVREVALIEFDGKGNLTLVDHFVINGQQVDNEDWSPGSGTYSVNENCTGTMQISKPGSPSSTESKIVVVRGGKEIRTVLTTDALTSVGVRVE